MVPTQESPGAPTLTDIAATMPTAWPRRLRRAAVDFGMLCGGIVAVTMLPLRVHRGDGYWALLVLLALLAVIAAFVAGSRALQDRSHVTLGAAAAKLVLLAARRAGLPLLGLAFFVLWTGIYMSLWLVHPGQAFAGLAAAPRISDFFYYAVSAALLSTPQDIVATSRGVRAATLIEMLMGFAVLATYLASFLDWRDDVRGR